MSKKLSKANQALARELAQQAAFSAEDAAYVARIEEDHADIKSLRDSLDRYDAINALQAKIKSDRYFKKRQRSLEETAEKPQQKKIDRLFIATVVAGGVIAAALCIHTGAPLGVTVATSLLGLVGGMVAGMFSAGLMMPSLTRKQEELYDQAVQGLKRTLGQKIYDVLTAMENDLNDLKENDSAVKAYVNYKPPTDTEVRQSIRQQFNTFSPVTAEDLATDIGQAGGKPRIRLKINPDSAPQDKA